MHPSQIIVLATPVFFLMIAIEAWVGWRRRRVTMRFADAMGSIGAGMLSQLVGLLTGAMTLGIYVACYEHWALWRLPDDKAWVWAVGLILYDFLYYWEHRLGHEVALLWAAHAVHHQSEDYNLSTALRQTSSGWIAGWIFFVPMALLGFSPLLFVVVGLVDLLYQYWVHTQQIGKLGWFDRWFCAPSNHRVHHAVNEVYLDRNYGGILIVWDRLFGSFQEELDEQPCVYGTRDALQSWNPIVANWQVYARLLRKTWIVPGLPNKLRVWFKAAHWMPAGMEPPKAEYDPYARPLYAPEVSRGRLVAAIALFTAMLGVATVLLWDAHLMSFWAQFASMVAVAAGLSGVAWLTEARRAPQPDARAATA